MIYQQSSPIELYEANGQQHIKGMAIVFYDGTPATEASKFGAFHRITPATVIDSKKLRAFWSHDSKQPIGSVKLQQEQHGISYAIKLNKTSWAKNAAEAVRQAQEDGEPLGTSFGADDMKFKYRREQGRDIAEVVSMRVFEISPTALPAFTGTSAMVASAADDPDESWLDEYQRWIITQEIIDKHYR